MAYVIYREARTISGGFPEKLELFTKEIIRGDAIASDKIPRKIALYHNEKMKINHIFYVYFKSVLNILCVSEMVKNFIENSGMNQCSFVPVDVYFGRRNRHTDSIQFDKLIAGTYYVVNYVQRLDTVDWDKSIAKVEMGFGFEVGTGNQIWTTDIRWPKLESSMFESYYDGLTVRKSLLQGKHIWRENLANLSTASRIFISDEFKRLIEKEKLGKFHFIHVKEV